MYFWKKYSVARGGSRIPRRRGRQPSGGGGAPTYDFAKFWEKLHEIEEILGHGGHLPGAPPSPKFATGGGSRILPRGQLLSMKLKEFGPPGNRQWYLLFTEIKNIFRAFVWLGYLVKSGSFFGHTILTLENQSIQIAPKYCISAMVQQ